MILINKLSPSAVFLSFGVFYLIAGMFTTDSRCRFSSESCGRIAIASPALITESVIGASALYSALFSCCWRFPGTVDKIAKTVYSAVVRGIQLCAWPRLPEEGGGVDHWKESVS